MSVVPAPSHAASPSLAGGLAGADDSVGAVSLLDASDPMASANQEVLEEAGSDYVPAHEEIVEYARWLGIRPDEDASMLWIAKEGLAASLPPDWKPCRTGDGQVYYFNFATGESDWDHPCDGIYRTKVEEARAKRDAARADASGSSFVSPDASADVSAGARDSIGAASLRDSRDGAPLTHRSDGSSRRSSLAGGTRSASPRPPAARGTPSPRPVGGPVPRVTRSPLAALDQNTLNGARNDPKRAAATRESASSARAEPEVGGASVRIDAPALAPAPALDRDVVLDRSGASDRSDGSVRSSRRGRLAMLPSRGESPRRKPSLALNLEGVGGGAANDVDASVDASEMMVESFTMDESLDESSDRSVASARSGRRSRAAAAAKAARTAAAPADDDDEDDTPDASAFIVGGGVDSPPESPGLGVATKQRSLGSRNGPSAGGVETGAFAAGEERSARLEMREAGTGTGTGTGTGAFDRSFPSLDLDDDPDLDGDVVCDALGLGAMHAGERSVPSLVLDDEANASEPSANSARATTLTTLKTLTTLTSSATSTLTSTGGTTFRATARSTADSEKAEALSMLLASDDDEVLSLPPGEAEYSADWDEDDAEVAGSNPTEVDLGGRVKMSADGTFKPLRAPQTAAADEERRTTTTSATADEERRTTTASAASDEERRTTTASAASDEERPRRARGSRMLRDAMNFSRDSDESTSPEEEKTPRANETNETVARAERAELAASEAAETAESLRRQLEATRDALERERRRAEAETAEEIASQSRDNAAEKAEKSEVNAAAVANAAVAAASAESRAESRASIARATAALTAALETGTAAHEKALRAEVATFERAAKALVDRAERAASAADRAASAADRAADRAAESASRKPARTASPSVANERRRGVVASPAASSASPSALGASLQLAAERATGDSPVAPSPPPRSPRAYTPGSSRTPPRRVPTPPERLPPADDPMETLTDVSSSLDDSLSPRGFGRRASSGSAGGRVGIRGRNLKPQPPRGPCPSDVSSDLGSSFGSGSSSVAPDSGGGGGDAGGGAIRSRRHVKGDARAAARASRHDAQVHGEGSPVTATRVVGGAGAAAGAKIPSFAPRGFGPGPASSRPDFDAVAGGTKSAPDGTFRGTFRGTPSGTGTGMRVGTSGFVSAGASAAADAARRAVATGEALVAKLERQRAAREVASKTARGSGSAAAAFDEASRKLEEWFDRERRSLGSFRRVAAILG